MDSTDTDAERRRAWIDECARYIDPERLCELVSSLIEIPSPTGDEAPLAEFITRRLDEAGLSAQTQHLDSRQANAWGRIAGSGDGPDLMFYAPLDTLTTGDPAQDMPWIGDEWRPDMRPHAQRVGDLVVGLGASNPKGHVACVIAAAEAIAAAGIPLRGDLVVALGAGGMPTNALPHSDRFNPGQGVGCSFLLEQGVWADYAIIAKPGWSVAWEEVGLAWFEVVVHGTHTYVGSRHRLPYRNAIVGAGEIARRLDDWFVEYAAAHTDGLVAPQGVVSSIEGGWPRMAAVTTAACRLRVDLRLSPRTTPMQARREFGDAIARIGHDLPDVEITWRPILAIPGATTDPNEWICGAAVSAWEAIAGTTHIPTRETSGATDANILRNRGIPTARVGMPKVTYAPFPIDFTAGMNTVALADMAMLTRLLVHAAVNTVTRSRSEIAGNGDSMAPA